MNPLISVIITSYNIEEYIEKAINSVLNQTYKPIELIVVDGGSTDKTKDIIASLSKQYNFNWLACKDAFASGSRNVGIFLSKGELIAFLDGDDEFYPHAMDTLYKALPHSYQMVYGDFHITSLIGEIIHEHIAKEYSPRRLAGQCYIHTGAVLMRRSVFDIVEILMNHYILVRIGITGAGWHWQVAKSLMLMSSS